jgi:hypothetical protein
MAQVQQEELGDVNEAAVKVLGREEREGEITAYERLTHIWNHTFELTYQTLVVHL